ncbi:MAG: hypothetical protein PF549_00210 [Patescibacteria group bacterium]|jgi:hypothetical protein|nr:hypothetical protein [Patescibacteria group bacterium]
MEDFSKKITETIKKDHIVPDSKLKIHWRNYAFWAVFSLIVLLGALFFSLIILNITDIRPELFRYLEFRKFFFLIFVTMPYLWMTLLLITIFSGFMIFRKTKRGYRYNILFVSGVVVLSISILGFLAHFSEINDRIERGIPGPSCFLHPKEGRWQRPADGLLGGEIMEIGDKIFFLRTPRGEDWEVFYSNETEIKRGVKIEKGEMVGVIGEQEDLNSFEAFIIIHPPFKSKGIDVKGVNKESQQCSLDDCLQMH